MITRTFKRLSVWLTLAALLGAAIPSGAQEAQTGGPQELASAGEIRLNLEESVSFEVAFLGRDPYPEGSSEAVSFAPRRAPIPELGQATAPAAWSSLQQQTQAAEAQAAPKKRGFGRWLKKHWYVPVLVAGAIGAAAASGGDDDSSGEDD